MPEDARQGDGARPNEQAHSDLFDAVLAAVHQRRWIRKTHASRTATIETLLAKHAKPLQSLPDD